MFVSRKTFESYKEMAERLAGTDLEQKSEISQLQLQNDFLKRENESLKERSSLKELLEIINRDRKNWLTFSDSACNGSYGFNFPDDVARYVDDYFGGKVLKQEATKLVKLDKNWNVTYHMTKRLPDKGFSYLLVRFEK